VNAQASVRRLAPRALAAAGFLALLSVPYVLDPFRLSIMEKALAFAIFALSLDLIWGIAGILSFGHAAFFGLGAYSLGLIARHVAIPGVSYIGLGAAVILPAVLAAALGYFTFSGRVSGAYFALITLAVSLILSQVATTWISVTGGDNGLYPVPHLTLGMPPAVAFAIDTDPRIYYFGLALLVAALFLGRSLVRSAFGQALLATQSNESRAECLGYDTAALKLAIFTISGGMAGLAGATYASIVGFVNPGLLGLLMSTQVIVWVALGGRGTLLGGVAGALVVAFLSDYLSGTFVQVWQLILGACLLLVVLFRPQGLLGSERVRRLMGTQ
jgi:urea transport system permease protein